ncbi:hypothetical protein SAMN04487819_1227 [Actinopolyspora alba]|uniref:Uncharacterized protein n=1 Tax=Actinopolyspora alba TaxID=673379 RepID=A0A1I2CH00_9ACTN|nr:hypothetical protein SAMN04487819_1227 [Actinopolyspora alba]
MQLGVPVRRFRWKQTVRDELILPEVRERINDSHAPSFEHTLTVRDAAGLQSVDEVSLLIRTDSMSTLLRELRRPQVGAIALAGQRGAGKTTLIQALAGSMVGDDEPRRLTITVGAPARYEARDFVLHLHARVCRAVLDHLTARGDADHFSAEYQRWQHLRGQVRRRHDASRLLRRLWRGLRWAVPLLVLGWLLWYRDPASAVDHYVADVRLLHAAGASGADPPQWSARHLLALLAVTTGLFIAVVNALGVAAIPLGRILGAQGRHIVQFGRQLRYSWHSSGASRAVGNAVTRVFVVLGLESFTPRIRAYTPKAQNPTAENRAFDADIAALRKLAEDQLRRVRYLQTHTSGWSGKLSASKGAEINWNRSLQHAEQPLTHPELVDQLRAFLERTVAVLRETGDVDGLVIAIDELDKMASPTQAHDFVNEIKGIFGITHCPFVVSVSDDALTDFERRGIPVRDALDSAFTTMISVPPFTLDESQRWLSRRVIGLPLPFIGLCHCLSGGIPRELSRTAIALHDRIDSAKPPLLEEVTHQLVTTDLSAKIRAFAAASQQLGPAADVDTATLTLHTSSCDTADDMIVLATRLLEVTETEPTAGLTQLRWHAASYLYYCATVLDIFDADLDESTLQAGWQPGPGSLSQLATARQALAVTPAWSWRLLTTVRKHWSLPLADETGTPAPIPASEGNSMSSTQFSTTLIDQWPVTNTAATYLGAAEGRRYHRYLGTQFTAMVVQDWRRADGATVAFCWPMPGMHTRLVHIADRFPGRDAYVVIKEALWGLHAPELRATTGRHPGRNGKEVEWSTVATTLGQSLPYWPFSLRLPQLILDWQPGDEPVRYPPHLSINVDEAVLLRMAMLYPAGHAVHRTLINAVQASQHGDASDERLLHERLADGRISSHHIHLAAEPVETPKVELDDLPEHERRDAWRQILQRSDKLAVDCVHNTADMLANVRADFPHISTITIPRSKWGEEFLTRLESVTYRAVFVMLVPDSADTLWIDPLSDTPVTIDPSGAEMRALAPSRLPSSSPLAELILDGDIWVRTENGTLYPAPHGDSHGLTWGDGDSTTLAVLAVRLLDDITTPGADLDHSHHHSPGLQELMQHPWPDGTVLSRAQLEDARNATST